MPATLFGFPATLTLDLDGEPLDVTSCIEIESATTGRGIFIDHARLIRAIEVEREVRKRSSEKAASRSTSRLAVLGRLPVQTKPALVRIHDVVEQETHRGKRSPVSGLTVTIRHEDGRLATLWADPTDDGSRIPNPLVTALDGSFTAWVEPGDYLVAIAGMTRQISVFGPPET